MPQARTRAYVLGQSRYGEQDKFVHLLSLELGRISGRAPGACRMRSRFGAALEMFTEADFLYYAKENQSTVTLSRVDPVRNFFDLVSHPENIFYFSLMSESLMRLLPIHQKEERAYRLVGSVLDAATAGEPIRMLSVYFLAWLLRIQGIMFTPGTCSRCSRTDLSAAWVRDDFHGVFCPDCHGTEARKLERKEITLLEWTRSHPPENISAKAPEADTDNLLRTLVHKIEHQAEYSLTSARCLPEFQ